ncbi:MAG: hypothetical protein QXS32_03430, partial [Candidatus Nezhaarchaeales archaeon]
IMVSLLLVNSVIGVLHEYRAGKAVEMLESKLKVAVKALSRAMECHTRMSSQLTEISLLQMLESLEVWRVLRGLARLVLPVLVLAI